MDGRSPESMINFRGEMDTERTANKPDIAQQPDFEKDKGENNLQKLEKFAKMFAGAFCNREKNN